MNRNAPVTAACTIISKNYLASARVLARSLRLQHPDMPFYVLLADRLDDGFTPENEPFELLVAEELPNLPGTPSFFFKYDVTELNTAVKPYFLAHLFATRGIQKLIYFDPDIYVFAPLDPLLDLLDRHAAVVTPHITQPIDDDRQPQEVTFLLAGTYNLGFLALSAGDSTDAFLLWWQKRLYDHCVLNQEEGYFTDQKWVNLAPCLFDGFTVLRDPGFNIAYWNLHYRGRGITADESGKALLGGEPIRFFHFSGFRPDRPEILSKYQDRYTFDDLPNLRPLFSFYARRLFDCGFEQTRRLPYAYGAFDNGVRIPWPARMVFREMGEEARRFADPFATPGDSFYRWLRRPAGRWALWLRVYAIRRDVRDLFPFDRGGFLRWAREYGTRDYGIDPGFVPPAFTRPSPGKGGRPSPLRALAAALKRRWRQGRLSA